MRPYAVGRVARSCRYCRWYNIVRVSVIRSVERSAAFASRKSKSKTEIAASSVPGWTQRFALFGRPLLIEGEDAAAYDQLLARVCAAAKPVNIIDEMNIDDAVYWAWEFSRYRRLKSNLIRKLGLEFLQGFLRKKLDYDLYSEYFADDLAEILQDHLPENQAEDAQTLAYEYARNEADAVDKVKKILFVIGLDMNRVLNAAKGYKAKELVQDYVRREPDAVNLVDELLTNAGASMDGLMADALAEKLDDIERIDRLISIAESHRNASLHEIDRRRAVLGETLRRSVQEIEDCEFEVIQQTPAQGKKRLDERPQDQGQPRKCPGQHRPEDC